MKKDFLCPVLAIQRIPFCLVILANRSILNITVATYTATNSFYLNFPWLRWYRSKYSDVWSYDLLATKFLQLDPVISWNLFWFPVESSFAYSVLAICSGQTCVATSARTYRRWWVVVVPRGRVEAPSAPGFAYLSGQAPRRCKHHWCRWYQSDWHWAVIHSGRWEKSLRFGFQYVILLSHYYSGDLSSYLSS